MINIKYTNGIFGGRRMGKEEIGKQIDSKKFSKTKRCYADDKIGNIIKSAFHGDFRNIFLPFTKKFTGMIDTHSCHIITETDIRHLTKIR